MNGIALKSRGIETIRNGRETFKRTVYYLPNKLRFFIKIDGEFVEVFHKADHFSYTNEIQI
jgi:hypothetical protein